MRRTPLTSALAALVVALLVTACGGGGDDDPEDLQADLSEDIQTSLDLNEAQADCFADLLVEEIGAEDLQDVDFSADEPPAGMEEQLTAAARAAIDECDIDPAASGG